MFLYKLMELIGWLTAAFVGLSVLTYVIKAYNRYFASAVKDKFPSVANVIKGFGPYFIKYHRYIGMMAAIFMLSHLSLNLSRGFISVTGLAAGGLLIITALIGSVGAYVIKKRGPWLIVHRSAVILMVFAILIHILLG